MKKIFSLLLVAALMLGLSVTAMAADETTDVVIEVMEEDYVATPFTGNLTGSDFWLETRYGFIQMNNDGTFQYKVNQENAALKASLDSGWSVVDTFILTFPVWEGVWEGRYMQIAIQPEGTKSRGYWTNYTITDLDEVLDGTILMKGESTTTLEWRYGLGRLGVTADDNESEDYLDYPKNEIFEIDGCGMACCLMRTEVIEAVMNKYHDCFAPLPGYGEDLSFCIRARACGYSIHADPRLQIGHRAETIITNNTFEAYRRQEMMANA
jgi:VCBS repeat-containing protein